MEILPLLILTGGKISKRRNGDLLRRRKKISELSNLFNLFEECGCTDVFIVDPDCSKRESVHGLRYMDSIPSDRNWRLHFAGGVHNMEDVGILRKFGVDAIGVGSICITDPPLVMEMIAQYPQLQFELVFDTYQGKIVSHGGRFQTRYTIQEMIEGYSRLGVRHFIVNELSSDFYTNPDCLELYSELSLLTPGKIYHSRGVGYDKIPESFALSGIQGILVDYEFFEKEQAD